MLQRSGEPHDVRRAARAGKPLPAAARVVLLEVIGPPVASSSRQDHWKLAMAAHVSL
jgi:hypothetical protein